MMGFQSFTWGGEPIPDIRVWAHGRGEQMVQYRATRRVPNLFSGRMDVEEKDGEMPESFWNSLLSNDGWVYTETGRYSP